MSKILIADDEAVIAFELETILSAMGYEVVGTAGSGAEAIELAVQFEPDLVLMDIMMPGDLDGIAAAEKIKSAIDVSIIFLTAYANDKYIERAKRVEPFGYLIKPFRDDQVKAAIEIALYKKKAARQLSEQKRLNELLLNSLPHPAMLVNNNRIVLAANRMAAEAGTVLNDYCWKTFGKCAYIPESDLQYIRKHPGQAPPGHVKCSFCLADEAMKNSRLGRNSEVRAFGRIFDTYWVPIDDQTYLHYAVDITQRQQMETELRRSHDELEVRVAERTAELKALSSKLLETQETERKRIANDLHDSIGQTLAAIKFGLENAIHDIQQTRSETDVSALQSLVPVARQACDDVRRIHTDLRPPLLDDIGLIATITWFCRELGAIFRGTRIRKRLAISEDQIPPELKIVIFRILQEALNNALKHADPKIVEVALAATEGKIKLTVRDDGIGFDAVKPASPAGLSGGFGLRSMKERTQMSGGSFSIESRPENGTALKAAWPVERKSKCGPMRDHDCALTQANGGSQ